MNERVAIGGAIAPRGSGPISEAVRTWKEYGHDEPGARDRLMSLWVESEAARLTNLRAGQSRRQGTPGPEGSIAKLVYAEVNKRIYEYVVELMGADGMLYDTYEQIRPDEFTVHPAPKSLPEGEGQLDRRWHLRDHEEHPWRARSRPRRGTQGG